MAKKKNQEELQPYAEYLETISRTHDRSGVFNDFLTMVVCTLSMKQKEDLFRETTRKYTKEEFGLFCKAFASLVLWMEEHPLEDAFGDYFQQYISKGHNAQFFTPPAVTKMMAAMIGPCDKDGPVYDPCCGSGRFFLAAAQENRAISFVGGDITEACCKMTLVNACLNDVVGEVYHMDSLRMEIWRCWRIERLPLLRLPYIREIPVARQAPAQEGDGANQAAG
ncbi:type I restriction endonuclease subunit M [Alistipes onderdonkii subsp. vulgaris]|uniref:N-6 DNA methylase n=1 Tax=Alistipes onderdonkii TaxID=328813 RepID=UPI00114498BB|nr:N-6 DNA methylase [Alistipes onderdonkii]BBL00437.1 type I restriction endonuclease subunit M [Alistipes onderdonkii subsp. vulgaris]